MDHAVLEREIEAQPLDLVHAQDKIAIVEVAHEHGNILESDAGNHEDVERILVKRDRLSAREVRRPRRLDSPGPRDPRFGS